MLTGLLALAAVALEAPSHKRAEADYFIVCAGPTGLVLTEYLTRKPELNAVLLETRRDSSTAPSATST